ncbi:hypothetical protein ACFY3N_19090 [Streptomyces sp. NPDC000348]|uniref:hypothetical protein n=1 Tax=Streptomyces sp. NPDC000348 TaxID=3364538 RepID=UPI00368BEC1C
MSTPHDNDASHPLEQVTGEKDVPPEEEGQQADSAGAQDDDADAVDTSAERERR